MELETMVAAFRATCIKLYNQVSELQYYQDDGPYLMALDETGGECEFHCYEFVSVEAFLLAPEDFAPAFSDPEFFFATADTLNLDGIAGTRRYYNLEIRKVVPDAPESRRVLDHLRTRKPDLCRRIILWNEREEMTSTVRPGAILWN